MNIEIEALASICRTKDITPLLPVSEDLFGGYADVAKSLKSYHNRHKAIPDYEVLQERFPDLPDASGLDRPEYYLDNLKTNYLTMSVESLLLNAANALKKGKPDKVIAKMAEEIVKLEKSASTIHDVDLTDYASAEKFFQKQRELSLSQGGTPGIPTTFKSIDSAYPTGMAPGHFIVAMGYTGRMKSFFTQLLATRVWGLGYSPMIISLEMSPGELRERIYPMMNPGKFAISDLMRGDVNLDDFRSWAQTYFANKPKFIIPDLNGIATVTPRVVGALAEKHKPDIIIFDYLQLGSDNNFSKGMTERMTNLSHELKQLGVSRSIPIIGITAVTDEDGDKRDGPPLLSQVSWSKAIEYDANLAFAVHLHDDQDIIQVAGRKNRQGPLFNFYLQADINAGIWKERFDIGGTTP